jgi:hypothetical protein
MKKFVATSLLSLALAVGVANAQGIFVRVGPPPVVVEHYGRRPSPRHVWVGGYYRWDPHYARYAWMGGHWAVPPHPGWVWRPGRWVQRPRGWVFVRGHWRR